MLDTTVAVVAGAAVSTVVVRPPRRDWEAAPIQQHQMMQQIAMGMTMKRTIPPMDAPIAIGRMFRVTALEGERVGMAIGVTSANIAAHSIPVN